MLGHQHDGETIAGNARERILRAEVALQATGDRQQKAVADDETEGDVHALELVDVDAEHARADAFVRLRPHHRHAQAVEHKLAVGEPRETVVHGIMQEPLVRAFGVGHVADKADAADSARVLVGHAGGFEFEPAVGIVRVAHAEIGADLGPRALLHGPQHKPEAVAVGGVQVLDEVVDLG
jgi:hypothetical protein